MKKVVSIIILFILLISSLNLNSFAATSNSVTPLWENTAISSENMVFDGTAGTASMRVTGKVGVNRIEGYGVLYKRVGSDWVYMTQVNKNVNAMSCYVEIQFTGEIGCEYKTEFTFLVYKNGVSETVQSTLTKVCE